MSEAISDIPRRLALFGGANFNHRAVILHLQMDFHHPVPLPIVCGILLP